MYNFAVKAALKKTGEELNENALYFTLYRDMTANS